MSAALLLGGLLGAGVTLLVVAAGRAWRARAAQRRAIAPGPGAEFTLGGRGFRRVAALTPRQHGYLIALLGAAGVEDPALGPGESPDAYVERIWCELHGKGLLWPMTAALLVPVGAEKWTPAIAAEVSGFLADLPDVGDQQVFYALSGEVVRPFCMKGLSWLLRSAGSARPSPPTTPATVRGSTPTSCPAPAPVTGLA